MRFAVRDKQLFDTLISKLSEWFCFLDVAQQMSTRTQLNISIFNWGLPGRDVFNQSLIVNMALLLVRVRLSRLKLHSDWHRCAVANAINAVSLNVNDEHGDKRLR